jgi:hypothetical protein
MIDLGATAGHSRGVQQSCPISGLVSCKGHDQTVKLKFERQIPMKHLLAAVLCVVMPVSALVESAGHKVAFDGGSIPQKAGASMFL